MPLMAQAAFEWHSRKSRARNPLFKHKQNYCFQILNFQSFISHRRQIAIKITGCRGKLLAQWSVANGQSMATVSPPLSHFELGNNLEIEILSFLSFHVLK